MTGKTTTDALLKEIADKAGVKFLSDLREINSARFLFSIFTDIDEELYTIDDWKNAVSYIFGVGKFPLPSKNPREIVLWNTGQWGQYITEVLEEYFASHKVTCCFHHITGKYGPKLSPEKKYLLFYHPSSINREEIKILADGQHLSLYFTAICSNYKDGILSMDNGDHYALKLPLEKDKIIRCYKHFNSEILKIDTRRFLHERKNY